MSFAGSEVFSVIDAFKGYWQIALDEKDKPKTVFTTVFGLFQWTVLPFGLTNAPATWQRFMDNVLAGLLWLFVLVYIDDVVIFSQKPEDHICHLDIVFTCLSNAGVHVSRTKCKFQALEIPLLGMIIDKQGIQPDPIKVKKVTKWQPPEDKDQLGQFLGLTNYYC